MDPLTGSVAKNPPSRPRVVVIVGTRPEAIKMAPVMFALRAAASELDVTLCATGQHGAMLDRTLAEFGLSPDVDLRLLQPGQTLAQFASRAILGLAEEFESVAPDIVLVQGDTTSAFAGTLAAYYRQIAVAHVEAGLRTGDPYRPFPEEGNRRLITALATLHFAPTAHAHRALLREGVSRSRIFITGNTVIDALLYVRRSGARPWRSTRRMLLVTLHRRESWGPPLESMCAAILRLIARNPDIEVVLPMHPAPVVREVVRRWLGGHPRIFLTEPCPYRDFVGLLDAAHLVLTDSGGIQEEAPALGKPVLVLRDKTERPEGLRAGTSRLVGGNGQRLLRAVEELLHDESAYQAMARAHNPYGDGHAAVRMVDVVRHYLGLAAPLPEPWHPGVLVEAGEPDRVSP